MEELLMKKLYTLPAVLVAGALFLTACGAPPPAATEAPATEAPTSVPPTQAPTAVPDLLSTIMARGTIVFSTDPAYPPQSALKATPERTAGSECTTDQKTL